MNRLVGLQIGLLCMSFSYCIYGYVHGLNELTQMKMAIPRLQASIQSLEDENTALVYKVNKAENPARLLSFANSDEYRHMHHPVNDAVVTIEETKKIDVQAKENPVCKKEIYTAMLIGTK